MQLDFDFGNIEVLINTSPLAETNFTYAAGGGWEHVTSEIFDDPFDQNDLLSDVLISLGGYAMGLLDEVNFYAKIAAENPKMTLDQLPVILEFESAVKDGLLMDWGITPDIARPPKGDGWEQYQAAKKAAGL